jgi:hypothetical protein
MFDGLWTVEFQTRINRYGRGILVINNGRILGGDDGYYYSGTCDITNNEFNADLTIVKYDANSISVFGDLDHFQLKINGQLDEYKFTATGTITNLPHMEIHLAGTKKEDL